MKDGKHSERYLLGSANWTFDKFFSRLERLANVRAPRFSFPTKLAVAGSQIIHAFYKQWDKAPPVEPAAVEMAEYFWYLDSSKAERELNFSPRDPGETLLDTVKYLRENFLAGV
jgi:dihydroflavonol-4-reductase